MIGLEVPHHDGSALYAPADPPRLGDVVPLFLRAPRHFEIDHAWLRYVPDGEATLVEGVVDRRSDVEVWWRFDVRIQNPITNYRFVLRRGRVVEWLTQAGMQWWEPTDATDFRLVTYAPAPAWAAGSVFYQIFPDRFASSGADRTLPDWAIPAAWGDPLAPTLPERVRQVYGGDLDGIVAHLGHLEALGVNGIYLTPIYPAPSNHRYDASSFDHVDPLLGGDEALVRLAEAARARGIRLMADLTSNHCGQSHDWFRAAVADPAAPEAGFFYFTSHPDTYAGWMGHPELPKFDHRNPELRRRLYEGADSVLGRWLRPPVSLDGWRIDVANMSGRYGDVDMNRWIARSMRWTMFATNPDAFLLAESFFDATPDLLGDGWHGVMNYAGFARPIWQWLAAPIDPDIEPWFPVVGRASGVISYLTMRDFLAAVPWRSALHNFNLLDSHDTARFRTITGDARLARVGVGLQMTFVGIPMIFAGDEVGLEGRTADDTRRPMPWGDERWDGESFAWYRELVALRRSSPALQRGGLRWVSATDDAILFLRETPEERLLVQASRAPHAPVLLDAAALGARALEPVIGDDRPAIVDGKLALPADGPAFHVWQVVA